MSITPEELKKQLEAQQATFEKQIADAKAAAEKSAKEISDAAELAIKDAKLKADKAETDLAAFKSEQAASGKTLSERMTELETKTAKAEADRDAAILKGKHADASVQLLPIYGSANLEPAMLMAEKHGLIDYTKDTPVIQVDKLKEVYAPPKGVTLEGVQPDMSRTAPDLSKALATRDIGQINAAFDAQLELSKQARQHRTQLPS